QLAPKEENAAAVTAIGQHPASDARADAFLGSAEQRGGRRHVEELTVPAAWLAWLVGFPPSLLRRRPPHFGVPASPSRRSMRSAIADSRMRSTRGVNRTTGRMPRSIRRSRVVRPTSRSFRASRLRRSRSAIAAERKAGF